MKSFSKKNLSLLVALSSAVACGAFVGCSSSDTVINTGNDSGTNATDSGGGGGTTTDDGGSTNTDGATGTDGSTVDDGSTGDDAGPTFTRTGTVNFTQTKASTLFIKSASATFVETTPGASPYNCTTTAATSSTSGATCNFIDCTYTAPEDAGAPVDAGDAATAEGPQAGDITMTGTSFPSAGVILHPDMTTGAYTVTTPTMFDTTTQYVRSGDAITYTADGDVTSIGNFTATLVGPADITVSMPTVTLGMVPAFSRGTDYAVAWSGGAQNTKVNVSLVASNSSTHESKSVVCSFDGFGSGGSIPTAGGLANLPDVDGTTWTGSFLVVPNSTTTASASDNRGVSSTPWSVTASVNATETVASFTTSN